MWSRDQPIEQVSEHVCRWGSDGQFGATVLTDESIILVYGHYCGSGTVQWLKEELDRRHDVPVKTVNYGHRGDGAHRGFVAMSDE